MKKLLLCLLLLASGTGLSAQDTGKWDFNASVAVPGNLTYYEAGTGLAAAIGQVFAVIFTFGLYKPENPYERTDDHTWPALALQGGYQVYDWMQVTGDLYYHKGGYDQYIKETDTFPAHTVHINRFALLPGVKFTYLNKGVFHMYSSLAAGAAFRMLSDTKDGETVPNNKFSFAYQLTPLGISVGNSFYGFLDAGIGSEYTGFRAGAGMRF